MAEGFRKERAGKSDMSYPNSKEPSAEPPLSNFEILDVVLFLAHEKIPVEDVRCKILERLVDLGHK